MPQLQSQLPIRTPASEMQQTAQTINSHSTSIKLFQPAQRSQKYPLVEKDLVVTVIFLFLRPLLNYVKLEFR